MAAGTVTQDDDGLYPEERLVRITTTGTTTTYICPYFAEIVTCVGNNESDDDGVGIGFSGQTITITVASSTDVVSLSIIGRQ